MTPVTQVDFTVDCDHGIILVEPLGSQADHSDWDVATSSTHLEGDSLYIATRPNMEGEVTVSVRYADLANEPPDDLTPVFNGRLAVPTRTLLIGDSDMNVEIRLPVWSETCAAAVLVDAPGLASRVFIALDG